MNAPEVLWLGEPGCGDCSTVGGKAAHLSRLARRYRVPPGFCLTAAAFDRATSAGVVDGAMPDGCDGQPPPAGPPGPRLPPDLEQTLADAYRCLGRRCGSAEPSVAVRSSAVEEDGAAASFAGQFETYLNVAGREAVAAAVLRCWASAGAPRVLEYRRRQGLPSGGERLAVLVQHLVVADVSAIVFSANPVTGDRDEVVITAGWGLGESVVGGAVTPDTYTVRKADLAVVSRQIADKRHMTVPVPGGTCLVDVPRFLRSRPTLDQGQAAAMARLAMALEAEMGWPVDVECALQAGTLYLLQCRPVTALPRRR